MKKTTEIFIQEAHHVHSQLYRYENFIYLNAKTKSLITCTLHGDFEQRPDAHLAGRGCPKCAGKEKKTKEQFVLSAQKLHGKKYNYSQFEYLGALTKGLISCPVHGDFEQRPNAHLSGKGCPKCSKSYPKNCEVIVNEAIKVHAGKYDYSKFIYTGALSKAIITCPEHGDFEQRPDAHLRGVGCPLCAKKGKKKTNEQFTLQAQFIHGERYDYSLFGYVNVRTKGTIICSLHGEFEQLPSNHLAGNGCPRCAALSKKNQQISTKKEPVKQQYLVC